jgi:hypothetical protein
MPEPFKPTWDERQRMKRNAGKLRHSVQQCQPEADGLRQAQPVCCYCDNDLSCAQCGREQPHDDVSALKAEIATLQARVEKLTKALNYARKFIDPDLDPPRMSNRDLLVVIDRALAMPLEDRK